MRANTVIHHVGELIRVWRKHNKLTGKTLSHRAGISRTTLTRWETGQTQPRMAELEAVLTALAVTDAQRQEALAYMEAPRAVKRLRDVADAGPPVCGDLLRAMRMRQGWTQQETAEKSGISQGTLARWERSEDWPSAERLHTLCYTLHAREAELIALTCGLVTAAPPIAGLDGAELHRAVAHLLFSSPLADLGFLALESHLWNFSLRKEAAKVELSAVYGNHARYLMEQQRFAEAAVYVARTHQLERSGYRHQVGRCTSSIVKARIVGAGQRIPDLRRAVKILRAELENPFILNCLAYRGWMYSEIAGYLVKIGEADAALRVSKQAVRMAERVDTVEPRYRRGDYARVLLETGKFDEALEECGVCLSLELTPLENLPFMLTTAEAFAAMERPAEARNWLQRMDGIIATHPTAAHYNVSIEGLRRRLQGLHGTICVR